MHSAPQPLERADVPVAAAPHAPELRLLSTPHPRRRPSARSVRVYALGALVGFLLAALVSAPGGGEIVATQLAGAAIAAVAAALARSAELRGRRPRPRLVAASEHPGPRSVH